MRLYNKYGWQKASRAFLAKNPVCFWCLAASESTDHIRPHCGDVDLFLDASNWQPLCHSCHNFKSNLEQKSSHCRCNWLIESDHTIVCGARYTGKTTRIQEQERYAQMFGFLPIPITMQEVQGVRAGFTVARDKQCRIIVRRCTEYQSLSRKTAAWSRTMDAVVPCTVVQTGLFVTV